MIAQLHITSNFSESLLQTLSDLTASHFILFEPDAAQLDAVQLVDHHIITDFTVRHQYINMYRLTHKRIESAVIIQPFVQPAIIYHREQTILLLKQLGNNISNEMDLFFAVLTLNREIHYDRHVVFNFNNELLPSAIFMSYLAEESHNHSPLLNDQLARYTKYHGFRSAKKPAYLAKNDYYLLPDRLPYLPQRLYKPLYLYFFNRKIKGYLQLKENRPLKDIIVFLGFDYGYRGNSKYLFEEMQTLKNNGHPFLLNYQLYFVTDEQTGEYFLSPSDEKLKSIVQCAAFIILESFPPDHLTFNGVVVNLWHGTPIKRLFLDSVEEQQNEEIFLYKLRKLNKMNRTDLFITDDERAVPHFKSAFQLQQTQLLPCGYPRVEYLRRHALNNNRIAELKQTAHIKSNKPVLFYCPTWRDYDYQPPDFSSLNDRFEVITKMHPEDQRASQISNVPLSTEDALLISDIVVSDYSSVIFDALAVNKAVYLLMDDFEQYEKTRGIYGDILASLKPYIYDDFKALQHAILTNENPPGRPIQHKESMSQIIDVMSSFSDYFTDDRSD